MCCSCFIYRRLKRPRRPKDPTHTIRHMVETMLREIAALPEPLPLGCFGIAIEPWLGAVPEWAARQPRLRSPNQPATFPARRRSIRTTTNSRFQKLTGLMRSGTSNNGRWERGDVRLPLEAELLVPATAQLLSQNTPGVSTNGFSTGSSGMSIDTPRMPAHYIKGQHPDQQHGQNG